jgi:pterin-4a-carbinolamine dehydratase
MTTVKCDPYEQGGKPLTDEKELKRLRRMAPDWELVKRPENPVYGIHKNVEFESQSDMLQFAHQVFNVIQNGKIVLFWKLGFGLILVDLDAHPTDTFNLNFTAGSAAITLHTPRLNGLTYNDFMLAVKIDGILEAMHKWISFKWNDDGRCFCKVLEFTVFG